MSTAIKVAPQPEYERRGYEVPSAARAGDTTLNAWETHTRDIFGERLNIVPIESYNLDAKSELSHTTTGLKYALRGRAEIIEAKVGERLAAFQDPIKAIMPVRIVGTHRVSVVTKMTVGGRAIIAPERAPARTVGVKETVREIVLERFGGDLEMNLNLQHEPAMFKEELDMKLQAQQRELERVLIEIGYDTLIEGGLRLEMAILRSFAGPGEGLELDRFAEKANQIYASKCFGTMNKTPFPLQSILSAAKHATTYSVGAPGSIIILPHGLPELLRYAKPESMIFNVNGLKTTDNKPISMDLGTGHVDPATNITMLTHIPLPTFEYGTANPRVGAGCLTERVDVFTYFVIPIPTSGNATDPLEFTSVNAKSKTIVSSMETPGRVVIRKTTLMMSSAILAAPGADTGELLVGMPHTGISTSQTDETMKMQLRVYLGAVLKRPESAIILPHIMCDQLVSQTTSEKTDAPDTVTTGTIDEWAAADSAENDFVYETTADNDLLRAAKAGQIGRIGNHFVYPGSSTVPLAPYAQKDVKNTGPLGIMDDVGHPEMAALMDGDLSSMMGRALPGYKTNVLRL